METKLQAEELKLDQIRQILEEALPFKYRVFFTCSEEKKGYSGIAVFERICGCTPLKAPPEFGVPRAFFGPNYDQPETQDHSVGLA